MQGVRGRSGEENRNYDPEDGMGKRVPTWMLVMLAFILGIAVVPALEGFELAGKRV